ncbi:MAG: dihydroneopterin aldolase family protein [Promethearchaeota archaeon]
MNEKKNNMENLEEEIADNFFISDLSNSERAAFELGIKLGALFHMCLGMPLSKNKDVIKAIEEAMEKSIMCQPYVKSVKIKLIRNSIQGEKNQIFDYDTLSPHQINAEVFLNYKNIKIVGKIEWNNDLNYPLMYISQIERS